jgi:hypothetical protein
MKITEIGYHPAYDPEKERIKFLQARQEQRLGKVFAMAKGELKRMAGMEFRADGTVDVMALDKALSGQRATHAFTQHAFRAGCDPRLINPAPFA